MADTDALEQIATEHAPKALGPYSQAVRKTPPTAFVYASGQLGIDPATGTFPEGGVEAQTRQAMENVKAILETAGSSLSKITKVTIFMADVKDFDKINRIYAEYLQEPYPARSAVQVAALPKGGLVEIEAEAYI